MTSPRAQLATCFMAVFLLMNVLQQVRSFPRQLSEGESCWDRGMAGRCRSLQDCEHARWALQSGRTLPTRCGFVGYQEVVCCTDAEDDASAGDREVRDNDVDTGSSRGGNLDSGSSNSRESDRENENLGGQPGSWNTHKPTGSSSLGSWNFPSINRRDSVRGNQNLGDQLGSWDTRQPAGAVPPGSRDTSKPPGHTSPGSWKPNGSGNSNGHSENDRGSSNDSQRRNQNLGGQLGSWDNRQPAGTLSPGSGDTHKPAGTTLPDRWKPDNSNSRDRHTENDRGSNRDSQRGDGNLGDQSDSRNIHKPAAVSTERNAQACESYKNFLNGPSIRILSGKNAREQEFPHMAALGYQLPGKRDLRWLCGGSLISDQYVLTAAHCCSSKERSAPVRVQLGTLNLQSSAPDDQRYGVREIIIHPAYSKPSYQGDIALIKLDRKVSFSETICPACLYTKSSDPQTGLIVTGWGATDALATKQSPVLLKSTIRPFPLLKCEQMYKERFPEGLDSSVMCAGDPQGKGGTCDGDSGGPLQIKENVLIFSIVGITSIGPSPCGGTLPSLYTRVSSYVEWIEKHVWP